MTLQPLRGKLLAVSLALAVCAQSGAVTPASPAFHVDAVPGLAAGGRLAANTNPDASLYTTYELYENQAAIYFVVCGTLPASNGCYGSGQFTGFGRVGAVLEGSRVVEGTTEAWRDVYVLDMADGGGTSTKTALYICRITEIVEDPANVIVLSSEVKKISLPLVGGTGAKGYMAANGTHVFIGTNKSASAVMVGKTKYAVTTYTGSTPAENVSSITADANGFVTTDFGGTVGSYVVTDSTGAQVQSQAGSSIQLGTGLGISTLDVDLSSKAPLPAPIVHYTRMLAPPPKAVTAAAPDAGLYRSWSFNADYKSPRYAICGSLSGSNGCYATGTLGKFGRVGAMVEGPAINNTAKGTVTRNIYVLDQAVGGGTSTAVALYVYSMVETVAAPNVSVSTSLVKTIDLPLTGGGGTVRSFLSANGAGIYAGTDQSPFGESISSTTYAATELGGPTPSENVSLITPDQYGYVALTYSAASDPGAFYVYSPTGAAEGDGNISEFTVGNIQGVSISDLPASTASSSFAAPRLQVHYQTKAL